MKTLNDFDSLSYAKKLADGIARIQLEMDFADPANRADWWKDVLDHLNRLLKTHYARPAVDPIPQPQAKPSEYRQTEATAAPWRSQPLPWKQSQDSSGGDIKKLLMQFKAEHPEGNYAGRLFDEDEPETVDRLTARIDQIGNVLIKALQSIDALEAKAPR